MFILCKILSDQSLVPIADSCYIDDVADWANKNRYRPANAKKTDDCLQYMRQKFLLDEVSIGKMKLVHSVNCKEVADMIIFGVGLVSQLDREIRVIPWQDDGSADNNEDLDKELKHFYG